MMVFVVLVFVLLGCTEQYPDECGQRVEHVNTKDTLIYDVEVWPCKRHRTVHLWDKENQPEGVSP